MAALGKSINGKIAIKAKVLIGLIAMKILYKATADNANSGALMNNKTQGSLMPVIKYSAAVIPIGALPCGRNSHADHPWSRNNATSFIASW